MLFYLLIIMHQLRFYQFDFLKNLYLLHQHLQCLISCSQLLIQDFFLCSHLQLLKVMQYHNYNQMVLFLFEHFKLYETQLNQFIITFQDYSSSMLLFLGCYLLSPIFLQHLSSINYMDFYMYFLVNQTVLMLFLGSKLS